MIIFPQPKKLEIHDGILRYTESVFNCDSKDVFAAVSDFCMFDVTVNAVLDSSFSCEEYDIEIDTTKIKIAYKTAEGLFRAFTTLKQIKSQCEDGFPTLKIHDFPDIKNRGYMLDISRGKIPTFEYLTRLADLLAELKCNQLQLYMDSFVFKFKNFEKYCGSDALTPEEIAKLDSYCKKRFINLVPNLNGFGHMAAWTSLPEYKDLAITDKNGNPSATLNPLDGRCLELLDSIYDGYFDNFSSDMVHIGMDEPFELGLNQTKEECDARGVGTVYTEYLNKVCSLIYSKYGKKPMFWDDIVFKHPAQLANIPKNSVVMDWGYEGEHHFDRNCRMLCEHGLKFYVCPGSSMWNSFCGRTNNAFLNIFNAAECAGHYGAEGFLLTEWGDNGHPQLPFVSFLPLAFASAVSWNTPEENVEAAYEVRFDTIENCKAYLDKFVYKADGRLADIVYRMGNYYLCERRLQFNASRLNFCFYNREQITAEDIKGFKRVSGYIKSLKEELKDISASSDALFEIELSCDIVAAFADELCGKSAITDRLKEKYAYAWKKNNQSEVSSIWG